MCCVDRLRSPHNAVDLDIARIPFLFYGANLTQHKINEIDHRLGCMTNHYLISKEIAQVLGYNIMNPNENKDEYFLNGTDVFGEAGYMKYNLKKQRSVTCKNLTTDSTNQH